MFSTIRFKLFSLILILPLLLTATHIIVAQEASSGSNHNFTIGYGGRVYNAATNQTTFTYLVSGTGVPPDLSHFDLEIPTCNPVLSVVAYSPTDAVSFGVDPTTGVNGIKWDLPLKVNESRAYTITFAGNIVEGMVLAAVKGGNGFYTVSVTGPSCVLPAIDVEKFISLDGGITWQDADAAPGPDALLGTQVLFRFVVTNKGNSNLSGISVTDSVFDLSACTIPATLPAAAFFECLIGPFDVAPGQHSNTATATGTIAGNNLLTSDMDSAHYFGGSRPAIDVEKLVSVDGGSTWRDADGPGPAVASGANVSFKFIITNTGNVALTSLTLSDSVFGTSSCILPASLAPGASFECVIGPFPASDTPHTNTATVTATGEGQTVTDSDIANYRPRQNNDDDSDVIIIIEGPVTQINVNIISIHNINIEVDPNNPILLSIKIGDVIRVEGSSTLVNGTIVIVAINIIVINIDIDGGDDDDDGGSGPDEPQPPPPQAGFSKDDCKKGGWQNLTRADGSGFRNQGDCIQYANTGK